MVNISLAPLQGFTDFTFRNTLNKYIGGIDKYYTPYIRLQNDGTIKSANIRDVNPTNNEGIHLIPQILVNNAKDFVFLGNYLADLGYKEMNWNLGCPYPMVAKRKLGSGLLPFSNEIENILSEALPKLSISISIKMRLGYENSDDINTILPKLNQFPLEEIIIHPRIGKQLYKGIADINAFKSSSPLAKIPIAYNGDITNLNAFNAIQNNFQHLNHIMIGRGLLWNPFLAKEIKANSPLDETMKRKAFENFHQALIKVYENHLSGNSHQLNKMLHLWEYFTHLFINQKKLYKRIKKIKNMEDFKSEIKYIILNEPFI